MGRYPIKYLICLPVFAAVILFYSCESKFSERSVERRAEILIKMADSRTLDLCRRWNCGTRRGVHFWFHGPADKTGFAVFRYERDTLQLRISGVPGFMREFPSPMLFGAMPYDHTKTLFDTAKHYNLDLFFYEGKVSRLAFGGTSIDTSMEVRALFPYANPYDTLELLSKTMDQLDVYGVSYDERQRGTIQFFLSAQDRLTWFPHGFNSKDTSFFMRSFTGAKQIDAHWYLQHFEGR